MRAEYPPLVPHPRRRPRGPWQRDALRARRAGRPLSPYLTPQQKLAVLISHLYGKYANKVKAGAAGSIRIRASPRRGCPTAQLARLQQQPRASQPCRPTRTSERPRRAPTPPSRRHSMSLRSLLFLAMAPPAAVEFRVSTGWMKLGARRGAVCTMTIKTRRRDHEPLHRRGQRRRGARRGSAGHHRRRRRGLHAGVRGTDSGRGTSHGDE